MDIDDIYYPCRQTCINMNLEYLLRYDEKFENPLVIYVDSYYFLSFG